MTQRSKDGWSGFARVHGVSLSALVEALGRELGDLDGPIDELPPVLRRAVEAARSVQVTRQER